MRLIKLSIVLVILGFLYLVGYNSGFDSGYTSAIKYASECKSGH